MANLFDDAADGDKSCMMMMWLLLMLMLEFDRHLQRDTAAACTWRCIHCCG